MSDINNFCKSLNDFVGNNKNKLLLHNIAKDRYSPNMFLFLGQYGIGKRTLAKLFALECNSNHCNNDLFLLYDYTDFNDNHLYDSIANVDNSNITRFIIINDFNLLDRVSQINLLNHINNIACNNQKYVFCACDCKNIIQDVIVQSLRIDVETLTKDDIIVWLNNIDNSLSDNIKNTISARSNGCLLKAIKLYERYKYFGEEEFLKYEESSYTYLAKFFYHVLWLLKNNRAKAEDINKHKSTMIALVDRIMKIPIAAVKVDYQNLFLDIAKQLFDSECKSEQIIESLIKAYDTRTIMNLYKYALDEFVMNSFDSDINFQTALLSIYQRLKIGI